MDEPPRHQYTIDLTELSFDTKVTVPLRTITRGDHRALANLMLDAYIGTTDYEDEGIDEALVEVETFLNEKPLLDYSFAVVREDQLLSACLLTTWTDGNPFVGYVMTRSAHKSQGLARACLLASLNSLTASGETTVNAFITEGNTPSERLFAHIGAHRVD